MDNIFFGYSKDRMSGTDSRRSGRIKQGAAAASEGRDDMTFTHVQRAKKDSAPSKGTVASSKGTVASSKGAVASSEGALAARKAIHDDDSSDDDSFEGKPGTPTTQMSDRRVGKFEEQGKVWFDTRFLQRALIERLVQSTTGVAQQNPSPTLFILVGPASVGKSSVNSLFPEMNDYVVNVDVDEIKLFGNEQLQQHPNPKKPGEMLSDVEGIQFKYDLVLEKLRPMVFENATMYGPGSYKNIILDTTGSMIDQIKMYTRMAKNTFGYIVKVIIVYSDKKQCLERVKSRNERFFRMGQGTRYIPPQVVNSIYDTFLKKNQASNYALGERMVPVTDELILIDNRGDRPIILVSRAGTPAECRFFTDTKNTLVGVDGAFYGLTLNPGIDGNPPSIVQGNINSAIEKAKDEWTVFHAAEKEAAAAKEAFKRNRDGGSSRRKRISRRRIHSSRRARKTIKKYVRRVSRRSSRGHRSS